MSDTLRRFIQTAICIAAALCCGDRAFGQISLDDLTGQGASGQEEGESALTPQEQIDRIRERIPAIEAELVETRTVFEAEQASDTPVAMSELGRSVDQLRQLLFLNEQLISEYQRLEQISQGLEGALADLRAAESGKFDQLPPYDYFTLDELLTDRLGAIALTRRAETELARARAELARAENRFEELRSQRRTLVEQTAAADNPADRTRMARRREVALIAERVGEANIELRRVQRDRAEVLSAFAQARLDTVALAIDYIEPLVSFTQEALDQRLSEIETGLNRLSGTLEEIRAEEATLRADLDRWASESPEESDGTDRRTAIAEETLRALGFRNGVLFGQRGHLIDQREAWNDRYRIAQGELSASDISLLNDTVDAKIESLDDTEQELVDRSRWYRTRLNAAQDGLGDLPQDTAEPAQQRVEVYRRLGQDADAALETLAQTRLAYLKLSDELGEQSGLSLWDRVTVGWSYLTRIWSYELIELDDDTALTVGKLLIGLALLAVAFNLSKWLSGLLSRRVLPRFGLHTHAASAFKAIAFYVLLLTFALMALRIINVPLTVFAVLGGAVAIGIGFGSQTIANNFMSGLILLAERPVRVGDFIEVGGVVGTVHHIGARSTRIKTPTNIEMILPNASLLENNLINWTLSDKLVWLWVDVGIAYGSPTREASKLLMRAAEEHGRVLKTPGPIVRFEGFGDNSLNFRLAVAINMNTPADRLSIPSDLRFRIDNLFRDAKITIAFPQRDVHIDTLSPLKVELSRSRQPSGADDKDPASEEDKGAG